MTGKFSMDNYVPVSERIEAFYDRFPDGSIQGEVIELTPTRVTVKAFAYRTPDDEKPGIGHSSLDIPGSTTFTRGSEVENAETSAWGRAIAALGFEVKRGIASFEEVRNKQPERSRGPAKAASSPNGNAPAQYRRGELAELMGKHGLDLPAVERLAVVIGIPKNERPMSDESMDRLIEAIEQPSSVPAPADPEAAVARAAASTNTAQPEGIPATGSAAPTAPEEPPPPPGSAPTDAEILEAAGPGAELVKPKRGVTGRTIEEAIADAEAKAKKVPA